MERKSLFTVNSWTSASNLNSTDMDNGYGVVKIVPLTNFYRKEGSRKDLQDIVGVLQDKLSFAIDSTWVAMDELSIPLVSDITKGLAGAISDTKSALGGGQAGAVYKSKKIWQRSGYLNLILKMRIVDWYGNGDPLLQTKRLLQYCVNGLEIKKLEIDPNNAAEYVGADVVANLTSASDRVDAAAQSLSDKIAIEALLRNISEDASDLILMKDSPVPVSVQVGKYFQNDDMVIENVSPTFSSEVSEYGPLHVDLEIKLSSRKLIDGIYDIGLKVPEMSGSGTSRVKFVQ